MNEKKQIEWTRDPRGCFICISHKPSEAGYPRIKRNRRRNTIARMILYKRLGFDLSRWIVSRHTCDNKMCINPAHIIHGTLADNNHDTVLRDRQRKGETHPNAKLKRADVDYILESGLTHTELGRKFAVTKQAIWAIRNGRTWYSEPQPKIHNAKPI